MTEQVAARRRKPEPQAARVEELSDSEADSFDEAERKVKEIRKQKAAARRRAEEQDDDYTTANLFVDILRVLSFLFLASCGLSYLISNGETFFWGMSNPPKYLRMDWWKRQINGPIYLTPAELAQYDGTDPTKPIYLAINWTIYDVSANRATYGPGGSYHWFAGCDASRAFVTGCFAEDRTPDMRGVEEMFLPIEDPIEDAKYWTPEELREMRRRERAEAKQRVHEALAHWSRFFAESQKYHFVGYVKKPEGWPKNEPRRKLCDAAAKGRRKRTPPKKDERKDGK